MLLSMRAMARDPRHRSGRARRACRAWCDDRRVERSSSRRSGCASRPIRRAKTTCTIGGAIACNASGARSLRYGATRPHVRAREDRQRRRDRRRAAAAALEKNTVGFHAAQDPVDWIVGSEGTLGVVVEAELALVPLPARELGLAIPFATERDALRFVVAAREQSDRARRRARMSRVLRRPGARDRADVPRIAGLDGATPRRSSISSRRSTTTATSTPCSTNGSRSPNTFGAGADDDRVYDDAAALREARRFRHAVPAFMNERGAARRPHGGRKVSTDWAVPYRSLPEALDAARRVRRRAHDSARRSRMGTPGTDIRIRTSSRTTPTNWGGSMAVVEETIQQVLALGGTVAGGTRPREAQARTGCGAQLSPLQLDVMQAIKQTLDPRGMFAPGNVRRDP